MFQKNTLTTQPRTGLRLHHGILVGLPLVAGLWLGPVRAQEGGVLLTLGVAQRFEASDNADLNDPSDGNSQLSTTQLSFGFVSETRISRLALEASGGLRTTNGLTSPQISLAYDRSVAEASLSLRAALSESDITDNNTIDLTFPTADDALADASGAGKQRIQSLDAALNLREDAPLSFALTAGLTDVNYIDTTDPALVNNRRTRAGITASLALSEVATANLGLRYATYEEDTPGATQRVTKGFDAGVDIERTNGVVSANFSVDDTPEGTLSSLSFGRSFDMPVGSLSADIGAARGVNGDTILTGGLGYSRELPLGQITARLRRDVVAGSDDTQREIAAMSLGYSQELTPLSSLSLNMNYSDSQQANTDDTTTNTNVGITYTRMLTEDWGLDIGYNKGQRRQTGTTNSDARSNTIFLELSRDFEFLR